jgi:enoyl-CoA hydratase/carnithine racemase
VARTVDPPVGTLAWSPAPERDAAFTMDNVRALEAELVALDRDPAILVCVYLHGAPRSPRGEASAPPAPDARKPGQLLTGEFDARQVSTPVVAGIVGPCHDEALAFVGRSTDIRVAGASARFGFPALRRMDSGPSWSDRSRLFEQLPRLAVAWLVLAGQAIDAEEALRVGLVNEVVPDEQVAQRCHELALGMARFGAGAVRAEKLAVRYAEAAGDANALVYGAGLAALVGLSRPDPGSDAAGNALG